MLVCPRVMVVPSPVGLRAYVDLCYWKRKVHRTHQSQRRSSHPRFSRQAEFLHLPCQIQHSEDPAGPEHWQQRCYVSYHHLQVCIPMALVFDSMIATSGQRKSFARIAVGMGTACCKAGRSREYGEDFLFILRGNQISRLPVWVWRVFWMLDESLSTWHGEWSVGIY